MKRLFSTMIGLSLGIAAATHGFAADIVDTAVGAGKFNTLAAALGAADLVETLKGEGPFTVFAPTDEAFAKLPEGTIDSLLKPEAKGTLTGILTYHVVAGNVPSDKVVDLKGAKTVNGQRVDISVENSTVMVDGAKVVMTDIQCDNGVIHVIDSVILPADKDIPTTADEAGTFKTLLAAADAGGLVEALSGEDDLTVFAPTDEAFAKLPEGTVESLLKPENKQQLVEILTYHVVAGRVYSEDAVAAKTAETLAGSPINISVSDNGAFINDSKLVATDIDASNGVIHVIDTVLTPPAKSVDARRVLQDAVTNGAALFNAGHHGACADLYHQTMTDLMSSSIDDSLKHHMDTVITNAMQHHSMTDRAWVLRRGIDQMYALLPSNR